jgi:hypothetical protein
MSNVSLSRITYRARRLWVLEALLVAGILAFGGFALMSDSRLSPSELLAGFSDIVAR